MTARTETIRPKEGTEMKIWISRDFTNGLAPDELSMWSNKPKMSDGSYFGNGGPVLETARTCRHTGSPYIRAKRFVKTIKPGQCRCFELSEIKAAK